MLNKNNQTLVLTGGHGGTTGLAVISAIKSNSKYASFKLHWIGSLQAMEGRSGQTLESKVFPSEGIIFHSLFSGRFQRKFSLWTIPSILKIPFGFVHAFFLLCKIKPGVILSFGGFVAFPVVVCGWLLGIPVIIHEQTFGAGRANRASSFFAKKILLARKESLVYFDKSKSKVVGNPISQDFFNLKNKLTVGNPPTVMIMGGSRGSLFLDCLIDSILEKLLSKYKIIHQAGDLEFNKFEKRKQLLPKNLFSKYAVYGQIKPKKMPHFYEEADIFVSRAGANTVSEIVAVGKPAVLIPIEYSYLDEQRKNAEFAEKIGLARILDQKDATPEKLLEEIDKISNNWSFYTRNIRAFQNLDRTAAKRIVAILEEMVE